MQPITERSRPGSDRESSKIRYVLSKLGVNIGHDEDRGPSQKQSISQNSSTYPNQFERQRTRKGQKQYSTSSQPTQGYNSRISSRDTNSSESSQDISRNHDSEDYVDTEEEEGGGVMVDKQPHEVTNDAPSEVKSEDAIIEDFLRMVPGISCPGREKVMHALLEESNDHEGAESLPILAFQHLHARFPNCTPKEAMVTVADQLYKEKKELLNDWKAGRDSLARINSTLQEEQRRSEINKKRAENLEQQVTGLRLKVEELSNLHVRSVNGIGAGIDPISDQTFSKSLADHHRNSYQWCRKNLGARGRQLGNTYDQLSGTIQAYLTAQCHEDALRSLPVSRAADMVLWKALHDHALKPWFPVNIPKYAEHSWEGVQTSFSKPDDLGHRQRIEFWRGYTACLTFQSPEFYGAIDDKVETLLADFVPFVTQLLQPALPKVNHQALRQIVRAVCITAAEMKCQRGHYEIEQISVGTEFNEDSMENADKAAALEDEATHYVRVVLSEGIVKRPYRGSPKQAGRVWMPQVFVGEKRDEIAMDLRGHMRYGTTADGEDVVMS